MSNSTHIHGYTPRTNVPIYVSVEAAEPYFDYGRWPSFSPRELACRGTGRVAWVPEHLDRLQDMRNQMGRPMIITSAYRSPEHNAAVGGASLSRHMEGDASDVSMANHDPHVFLDAALGKFPGIGTYPATRARPNHNFIHVDSRATTGSRWGNPFPPSQVAFSGAEEARPAPMIPTAGVATAGVGIGGAGLASVAAVVSQGSGIVREVSGLSPNLLLIIVGTIAVAAFALLVFGPERIRRLFERRWSGDDL